MFKTLQILYPAPRMTSCAIAIQQQETTLPRLGRIARQMFLPFLAEKTQKDSLNRIGNFELPHQCPDLLEGTGVDRGKPDTPRPTQQIKKKISNSSSPDLFYQTQNAPKTHLRCSPSNPSRLVSIGIATGA